LNEEEVSRVVLDEMEYCDSEWKLPSEILEGNYHPALKFAVGNLMAGNVLEELEKKVKSGGGGGGDEDAEIAALAREFIKRRNEVGEVLRTSSKEYKLFSKELNYETTVNTKF
jgi:hypothetical protein